MASERIQRRIDRLLDQIEEAADQRDWENVRALAMEVVSLDPDNVEAPAFLKAAETGLAGAISTPSASESARRASKGVQSEATPTSFADGRYQVKRFLRRRRQEEGLPRTR